MVACGLEDALQYLHNYRFSDEDIQFLRTQRDHHKQRVFGEDFLRYLREMRLCCEVDAVPEGTLVFPYEPLLRVKGPIMQCQLVETALVNIMNFQSLIATKTARMYLSAQGDSLMEFGLRRAHGLSTGLLASRAAYIGGASSTSNVLAGKTYGIPISGTQSHSWVLSFASEEEAFAKYCEVFPHQAVFLVDTYDTLTGLQTAIKVALRMREKGSKLFGVRIDSGDLSYYGQQARLLLNKAGLEDTKIIASDNLDEWIIQSLKEQHAAIDAWGVGTRLVTAHDDPSLGAVYKLSCLQEGGKWVDKIKVSNSLLKTSTPGILQVRRFYDEKGYMMGDMVYDVRDAINNERIISPTDPTKQRHFVGAHASEDLLVAVVRDGERCEAASSIGTIRARHLNAYEHLHKSIQRLLNPHEYPVGLAEKLYKKRMKMTRAPSPQED